MEIENTTPMSEHEEYCFRMLSNISKMSIKFPFSSWNGDIWNSKFNIFLRGYFNII